MSENLQLASDFLNAWASSQADRFTSYLDREVSFESPMATLQGRDAVAAAMSEFAQAVTGIKVLASAASQDSVLIMYDMHTGPFGTIRAAEHYRFRDGKIVSDQLVFDAPAIKAGPPG